MSASHRLPTAPTRAFPRAAAFAIALVAVAGLEAAAAATPASAYRTSEDSLSNQRSGIVGRIAFSPRPVPFAIYRMGSDDVAFTSVEAAVMRAFDAWTAPSCTSLTVRYDGATDTRAIFGDDVSVFEWVESGWSGRGYGAFTIGVTTNQFFNPGSGWYIDESDMELNGVDYAWVIDGARPTDNVVDIEGLVAHESGHWLGVLHPCELGAFDGAPECVAGGATPTMWPRYTGEEQRTLEPDDQAAICYLYPGTPGEDGGVPIDAGGGRDGGTPGPDAGRDAGSATDAAASSDASSRRDGGITEGRDRGCRCATPGGDASHGRPPLAALGVLFVLLLVVRRPRRGHDVERSP